MKLVIVESPGKVKTIEKYLGSDYKVKASVGHCYHIDPKDGSIDIENNYEPKYVAIAEKNKVIGEIKALAKTADIIYIASDPDREGEAIGYHIVHRTLAGVKCPIKRITFNAITKPAVLEALQHPRDIDINLFNAQQARSVLDMLVGYRVSPVLWKKVCKGTSAGRVQSIGLELIVERQKEIDAFKSEEYWDITGRFQTQKHKGFSASYDAGKKITNENQAKEIVASIESEKKWSIASITPESKSRSPFPLFHTSSLQQFGATTFGWDNKKTMSVAQALYEGFSINGGDNVGLISYHRTDSFNISPENLKDLRDSIKNKFGSDYVSPSPRYFKSKNKAEQGAHEGIHPTHLDYTPAMVKSSIPTDEARLYEAIYNRYVACQMSDAQFDITKVSVIGGKHTFHANGQTMKFEGFLKVWSYSSAKEEILPDMAVKDEVFIESLNPQQHFTKPPAALNPASLTKALEENGVGRPSTYASIVDTLLKRDYVTKNDKAFAPTDLGRKVCTFLMTAFPELMDVSYTARIEDHLDDIAEGKKVWYEAVDGFFKELKKRIDASKDVASMRTNEATDIICPTCGNFNLVKKSSRYGEFYGCSGYAEKKCKAIFKIGPDGSPLVVEKKEKVYIEGAKCDKCGSKIVVRKSARTGKEFGGCSKWPSCKGLFDLEGKPIEFKKRFSKKKD